MRTREKPEFVQMFLRGNSLRQCATVFGIRDATAEQIVREAIQQLAALNQAIVEQAAGAEKPREDSALYLETSWTRP